MPQFITPTETLELPLLATTENIVYPLTSARLESDDPRFADVLTFAEKGTQSLLVHVLARAEGPLTKETCYTVGTICRIARVTREPEDSYVEVYLEGICRAKLLDVQTDKMIPFAEIAPEAPPMPTKKPSAKVLAMMHEVRRAFASYFLQLRAPMDDLKKAVAAEQRPGVLADMAAGSMLEGISEKQALLELFDPTERLVRFLEFFKREEQLRTEDKQIEERVRERMDLSQREYYLQEKMRVVRDELDRIGTTLSGDTEVDAYFAAIQKLPTTDEIKEKLTKEAKKLTKIPYHAPEYTVIRAYLDTVLTLPFETYTEDRADVAVAREILDRDHAGLEKVKARILEFLAVRQLNPSLGTQILCLVGAPGTGKSSVATSIAEATGRKFVRVSLGGVRDEAEIRGHRKTYVASMPGRIVNALIEAGSANPVVLLDEIDKLANDAHGDPSAALLEVLDGDQNRTFRDHFVEFPIDLSRCMFIATANTLTTVPKPLLDRMEVIELPIYTPAEKQDIGQTHLLPKQMKRHGLPIGMLRLAPDAWTELIDFYTHEAGVRQLERLLASLCRKVAMAHLTSGRKRFTLHAKDIKNYFAEEHRYLPEQIADADAVGVVNGLAYTEIGGTLLSAEVAVMPGTGKIELTGSLGDVMKESARTAVSVVRTLAEQYAFSADFWKEKDIHIHFPEGAVPKDGPSAGVTVVTALCSALSNRPVRREVAMTGEISLRGRVLAIGGVKEKLTAAYRAGARVVCLPAENAKDLHTLDADVREGLEIILCRNIEDVLKVALV